MIKRLFTYLWGNVKWNVARLWSIHKKERSLNRVNRKLKKAKRLALKRQQLDGRRYYVLPDAHGDLVVVNGTEVDKLKKLGVMNKRVAMYDLMKEALYWTPALKSR